MSQEGRMIVVMGVSGCGKSTIAEHLAANLDAAYLDADSLHPPANVEKMRRGDALDDSDRAPWLVAVRTEMARLAAQRGISVTACSALKANYREALRAAGSVAFVFLEGSHELISSRMKERTGHFMPSSLLDSQFAALEHPGAENDVYTVGIEPEPQRIADLAQEALTPFLERASDQ